MCSGPLAKAQAVVRILGEREGDQPGRPTAEAEAMAMAEAEAMATLWLWLGPRAVLSRLAGQRGRGHLLAETHKAGSCLIGACTLVV